MAGFRAARSLARQLAACNSARAATSGIEVSCRISNSGPASAAALASRQFTSSPAASAPVHIEDEPFARQRQQLVLGNRVPTVAPDTWLAPSAVIIGDVDLYDKVSVWYGAVLRGDLNTIKVGHFSNIQDRTVLHAARSSPTGLSAATLVGRYTTIGQSCVLRSTIVGDECIIGDKSMLLEGSMVEHHAVLAPGSVLPPGRLVPSGQLWAGNPARYVRDLTKDEKAEIATVAQRMFPLVDEHASEFLPYNDAWEEAQALRKALAQHASV